MRPYTVILTALILSAAPVLAQTAGTPKPAAVPAATAPNTPARTGRTGTTTPMSAMNVNTATEAQIAAIPGIGPKLAAAIVKARPFKNSAELIRKVKGIGPKNYLKLGLDKAFIY